MLDLASHIMDIVQNSIRAKADRVEIEVNEDQQSDHFIIEIHDNGSGMDKETLDKVRDPFFTSRSTRKVGLGIPLLQQCAEQAGGNIIIASNPGKGTTVTALFIHSHLDRPPLGNISETISLLLAANPSIQFLYRHTTNEGYYFLDTEILKKTLDGVAFSHPDLFSGIQALIHEKLTVIKADNWESMKLFHEDISKN